MSPSGSRREPAARLAMHVAVIPGLDHLRAGGVAPGLEDLDQPLLDVRHRHADRARGGFEAGAVGCFVRGGGLISRRYGLSGSLLPLSADQSGRNASCSALRRSGSSRSYQQPECADAIDRAALELQVVADLAITGGERGREAFVAELGSSRSLQAGRRACSRPRDSDRPVGERDAHRGERGLVRGRSFSTSSAASWSMSAR